MTRLVVTNMRMRALISTPANEFQAALKDYQKRADTAMVQMSFAWPPFLAVSVVSGMAAAGILVYQFVARLLGWIVDPAASLLIPV